VILLTFRHGLRAAELVGLRWDQVDFDLGVLHVRRAKASTPATHPLTGRELRAFRRLQRETGPSTHLFMSERKAPISVGGFQKMLERLSVRAKLGFQVHARMLRHACGFKMANDAVDTRTMQAYLPTRISGIRCATRSCRQCGSRGCGGTDQAQFVSPSFVARWLQLRVRIADEVAAYSLGGRMNRSGDLKHRHRFLR
jgi:hypothetical protein